MSRNLLLLSTSRVHSMSYLAYCREHIESFWGNNREIIFVPYAAQDYAQYAKYVQEHMEPMGFKLRSIHECANIERAIMSARGIFIGGGNTFLLAKTLQEKQLYTLIQERVLAGELLYMGASAGSNITCPSIKTTNDMPIVQPLSFDALELIPFQINPHYLDPDPSSKHMGETREKRLEEFHEWSTLPVLGLREGAIFEVHGNEGVLKGISGARLFQAGQTAVEYSPGDNLSFLLG